MRRNPPRLLQELCVCDQQDNLPGAPPTSPWAEVIMMTDNIYLTATWMQKRLSLQRFPRYCRGANFGQRCQF